MLKKEDLTLLEKIKKELEKQGARYFEVFEVSDADSNGEREQTKYEYERNEK